MFTPQEVSNAVKFPDGSQKIAASIDAISKVGGTSGHLFRDDLIKAIDDVAKIWRAASNWFSELSGTPLDGIIDTRQRDEVIVSAKTYYDQMMALLDQRIADTSPNELSTINSNLVFARNIFSGFNWSLPYSNPRHEDRSSTPFDESKTVIGPHGDWVRATAAVKYVALAIAREMLTFNEIYRTVPIYDATANRGFNLQMDRFGRIVGRIARVWGLHIEVEIASDKTMLDGDAAASPPTRTRAFLRTLLQEELLFNNRGSNGTNWRGRAFQPSIALELRSLYIQEFIAQLGQVPGNGQDWAYELVVGKNGERGLIRILEEHGDLWRAMDSWNQSAFGFYHPLPSRDEFVPVNPDGTDVIPEETPGPSSMFPLGYFDSDIASIEQTKASISSSQAHLDAILANLRGKEGLSL